MSVFDIQNTLDNMYKFIPRKNKKIETPEIKKNGTDKKGFKLFGEVNEEKINSSKEELSLQSQMDIEIEKNKRCGSIDRFNDYLQAYTKSKSNFTIISYGTTKKLIYGRYSNLFNGVKGEKKPQGLHLISLAKKDIDNLLKGKYDEATDSYIYKFEAPKIPKKKPYLTFINHTNLEWYGEGEEALAIDINHCYWRTAFLLGYITEKTYKKGIEKKEYKDGRLIAIGTLGKKITISKYELGVKVKEYVDDTDYIKYGGFYWAVIIKVHTLMLELWNCLKHDFLMFLTDCVVINPTRKNDAIKIMEKHGYSTKEYSLIITEITDTKVSWITDEGEPKQIIHNKLLGENNKKNLTN